MCSPSRFGKVSGNAGGRKGRRRRRRKKAKGRMPLRSLLRHSWARLGHLGTVLETMLGLFWDILGSLGAS
eukprot:8191355-Pyramimonas_sp.AAC.1